MKKCAFVLLIAGILWVIWGYTSMIERKNILTGTVYDEMDGLYPFFGLLGGVLLLVLAVGVWLIAWYVKRYRRRDG